MARVSMDPQFGRRARTWAAGHRCPHLFFALLALLVLAPLAADTAYGRIAANLMNVVVVLSAAALGCSRPSVVIDLLLAVPFHDPRLAGKHPLNMPL